MPHPLVRFSAIAGLAVSTRMGGAKTVAVAERTFAAFGIADDIAAPTGNRGAAGLAFCAWLRRTGAKARAALHPLISTILVSINGIYAFKAVIDEKIPAVAFPGIPPCPCSAEL